MFLFICIVKFNIYSISSSKDVQGGGHEKHIPSVQQPQLMNETREIKPESADRSQWIALIYGFLMVKTLPLDGSDSSQTLSIS